MKQAANPSGGGTGGGGGQTEYYAKGGRSGADPANRSDTETTTNANQPAQAAKPADSAAAAKDSTVAGREVESKAKAEKSDESSVDGPAKPEQKPAADAKEKVEELAQTTPLGTAAKTDTFGIKPEPPRGRDAANPGPRSNVLVARMNRRQLSELSSTLGPRAELKELTESNLSAQLGLKTGLGRPARPTASTTPAEGSVRAAQVQDPQGLTLSQNTTPTTRPATGFAYRGVAPGAPARDLRLDVDPMDQPVDVYIVLQESPAAGTTPPAAAEPAPAKK
jgi:hypothetical protein